VYVARRRIRIGVVDVNQGGSINFPRFCSANDAWTPEKNHLVAINLIDKNESMQVKH